MDSNRKGLRIALIALALAGAVGAGALVAKLGFNGGISYTEPRGNPSVTPGAPIAPIAAAARQPAKDLAFTDESGRPLRLAEFKGRVVLFNLWATWCPPCIAEMPSLDGLAAKLGGARFQVVAVSLDRGGAGIVRRWFDKTGIRSLPLYTADAGQFVDAMLPTSILIDADGRVAWQGHGAYDWEGAEAVGAVEALLAEGDVKG